MRQNPTQFIYDGSDIVAEVDSQEGLVTYLRGLTIDEPFIRQTASGNEFYHVDVQGSAVVLSDDAGMATTSYTYDPFGKATITGASANAFQYTSRENDYTGLYYYRARYYSPIFHRFISEDPIGLAGGDENFYAYVQNQPGRWLDPLGLAPPANAPISETCDNIAVAEQWQRDDWESNTDWLERIWKEGVWDYKNLEGFGSDFEDFGNYNYGLTGSILGHDSLTIQLGAGGAQLGFGKPGSWSFWNILTFLDGPNDNAWVREGIADYQTGYWNDKCDDTKSES